MFAALLIAPKVVDSEAVKARVRSEIKETADIDIDFEYLVLYFFFRIPMLFWGIFI